MSHPFLFSFGERGHRSDPSYPNLPLWLLPPMLVGFALGGAIYGFGLLWKKVRLCLIR